MTGNSIHYSRLRSSISQARALLLSHAVYESIKNPASLKVFMGFHVFAVWDFMSLLKSLQQSLTCVNVPWYPVSDSETAYLINEIVLGEETDIDSGGRRTSHFQLYLEAMKEVGADVTAIGSLLENLRFSENITETILRCNIPKSIKDFLVTTFETVYSKKPWVQAAVFTFGREDLIPSMFLALIDKISVQEEVTFAKLRYYLQRHIEVDGDHHSHLAIAMTQKLCGNDEQKWLEAAEAVNKSLCARIALWDGVMHELKQNAEMAPMNNGKSELSSGFK